MKARRLSQAKMVTRDFDQKITLQAFSTTSDGAGGSVKAWANFDTDASVWAHVMAKGGREQMVADQQSATQLFLFTIRNRSDVSEADRIQWDGDYFNIRRVERQGGRKMYLVIEAERGVAD